MRTCLDFILSLFNPKPHTGTALMGARRLADHQRAPLKFPSPSKDSTGTQSRRAAPLGVLLSAGQRLLHRRQSAIPALDERPQRGGGPGSPGQPRDPDTHHARSLQLSQSLQPRVPGSPGGKGCDGRPGSRDLGQAPGPHSLTCWTAVRAQRQEGSDHSCYGQTCPPSQAGELRQKRPDLGTT